MKKLFNWLWSHPVTSVSIVILLVVLGYLFVNNSKISEEQTPIESPFPKAGDGFLDRLKDIKMKKEPKATPSPTFTQPPSPTPRGIFLSPPVVFPEPGDVELGNTTNAISLFFETEISLSSVKVETPPRFEFEVKKLPDFKNRIILSPKTKWKSGFVYKIKILKGVKSLDGLSVLDNEILMEYRILPVKPPSYTQPS